MKHRLCSGSGEARDQLRSGRTGHVWTVAPGGKVEGWGKREREIVACDVIDMGGGICGGVMGSWNRRHPPFTTSLDVRLRTRYRTRYVVCTKSMHAS